MAIPARAARLVLAAGILAAPVPATYRLPVPLAHAYTLHQEGPEEPEEMATPSPEDESVGQADAVPTAAPPAATPPPTATRPIQPSPTARPAVSPTPVQRPTPLVGQLFAGDNFDDPVLGILPKASSSPSRYSMGYEGGQYIIRRVDKNADLNIPSYLPGTYQNASLAVDAQVLPDFGYPFAALACRWDPNNGRGYALLVYPGANAFALNRQDGPDSKLLTNVSSGIGNAPVSTTNVIKSGTAVNHIELRCAGNIISAIINGTIVGNAVDDAYTAAGYWFIDAGLGFNANEARFDNLTLTRQ